MVEKRFLRLKQIIGDPKNGIAPIIPVSESTWWRGVRNGKFPAPKKLNRITFWLEEDITKLIEEICESQAT